MYTCKVCEAKFVTSSALQIHKDVHKTKRYSCQTCKKLFLRKRNVAIHIQNHHKKSNLVNCKEIHTSPYSPSANAEPDKFQKVPPSSCIKQSSPPLGSKQAEISIIEELEGIKEFAQSILVNEVNTQRNGSPESLNVIPEANEILINTDKELSPEPTKMPKSNRKGFVCPTCEDVFRHKRSLTRHNKEKHSINGQWECRHCRFYTSRRSNLIRHMKTFHSDDHDSIILDQINNHAINSLAQPPPNASEAILMQSDVPDPNSSLPQIVTDPSELNTNQLDDVESEIYTKFAHFIDDHTHYGTLQNRYNINLNNRTVSDALEDIFEKQTSQFKCNIAFGFILRHKITGQLSYYYASRNTALFDEPVLIGHKKDLNALQRKIRNADVFEHVFQQRPDTRYVVQRVTNALIYITKLLRHPIGDPGESEFEEFLLSSRSVKSMINNSSGDRYQDKLCFFRCLAYAKSSKQIEIDARNLLAQWTSQKFDGLTLDDLNRAEKMFNCRFIVYTLVSNERPFGDDGDINELLIAEIETAEESIDVPPISAQILRRSLRSSGDLIYLNYNHGHFSLITNLSSFIKSWRCSKCDRLFDKAFQYHRHEYTCDEKVKFVYPSGGHGLPPTVFDQLADEGIFIEDRIYPFHVAYDFEARFSPLNKRSEKLQYTNKLIPVSFSVASNVAGISEISGKSFETPFCVIDEPEPMIQTFYEYLKEISNAACDQMRDKYRKIVEKVESQQTNVYKLRRELAQMKKEGLQHEEILKQQVRIREAKKWIGIKNKLENWLGQLPIVGFNSGKFDINLIRCHLVAFLLRTRTDVNVIKKASNYMVVSTPHMVFIDISNYLAVGTSYAKWLKAFNVAQEKGKFCYEWLTSLQKLDQDYLPPHEEFYSTLRQSNISTEEYMEIQKIWKQHKFRNMRDYLVWYNNLDVLPFLEALSKMKNHWKQYDIDMLKGGAISLPGLAYIHMFKTTDKNVIIPLLGNASWYKKVRENIVGGPSIIFSRYHESGKTKIKEKNPVQNIVGYDANSLYLWCIGQNMPTGHYGILEATDDRQFERVPPNPTVIDEKTITDIISRNLSRQFKRKYGMESSFEEYIWCEWMRRKLSKDTGKDLTLRHYVYGNQKVINIGQSSLPVDGYIPELGVILQYHGCIFHGHVCIKNADSLLTMQRKDQTTRVRNLLRSTGLRLIEIYQCQFYRILNDNKQLKSLFYGSKLPKGTNVRGRDIITGILKGTFFGVVECDIMVPWWKKGMREKFQEMTPIFKNTEVSKRDIGRHMREYVEGENILHQPRKCLIGSYYGEKITLISPLIKWYLSHGLVITNVYGALQYKPKACFRHLVDEVATDRREADNNPDKAVVGEQAKLRGNSFYGKCMTDLTKHMDISYMVERDAAEAINEASFRKLEEVSNGIYEISNAKKKIVFKLPIIIAYFVYGYAKLKMLQFYYDFIDKYIDRSNFECISMDTDSLYMAIGSKNIASLVRPHLQRQYDMEVKDFLATDAYSQRTPGLFKLEYEGEGMVALNSKTYSIWKENGQSKYSSKGLSKVTNSLCPGQFKEVLETKRKIAGTNTGFRMLGDSIAQYSQQRHGLTYLYIKRRVREDGIGTDPLLI